MTVFEVPNIENVSVVGVGDPVVMYRLTANDGWWLHLNDGDEENALVYKRAMILRADRDWSQLQVVADADLPEGAETADREPETETM